MRKVLCVCLGNTCRSPMMERMLRAQLQQHGITDVEVESAGLRESAAGQLMAEFSMNELNNRGIDASGHIARYIGPLDLGDYDFIVTVGDSEAKAIQARFSYSPKTPIVILGGGVPNPWQQGEEAYRNCASLIEEKLGAFIRIFQQ